MNKSIVLSALSLLMFVFSDVGAQSWNSLITDPAGDEQNSALIDATQLDYKYNSATDSLWFRISLNTMSSAQSGDIGVNVMARYPGGGPYLTFGTTNNTYNKLITMWITGMPPSSYSGVIGISDSAGVATLNFTNLFSNNLSIQVDQIAKTITMGMKRSDLLPLSTFGQPVLIAAAVGSSVSWNDDMYSSNAYLTLQNPLVPSSTFSLPATACTNLFVKPSSSSTNTPITFSWSASPASGVTYSPNTSVSTPSIYFTNSGNYTVTCSATSTLGTSSNSTTISLAVCDVGIAENTGLEYAVLMFPNPTSGELKLMTGSTYSHLNISVSDAMGRLVYKTQDSTVINDYFLLDLTNQEAGIYFIHLNDETESATKRMIIAK